MAAGVGFTCGVAHGFIMFDSFASPIIGGLDSFSPGTTVSNLASPTTIHGQLDGNTTLPSGAGPITFNIPAETPGSFTISSVPEPAASAATLVSARSPPPDHLNTVPAPPNRAQPPPPPLPPHAPEPAPPPRHNSC